MNYIIIGIVAVIVFFAYEFFSKNDNKSTKQNYSSKLNLKKQITVNDKQILVENVEYNLIKKAIQDFTNNYDNPQLKPISKLHKIDNNRIIITFPYDIDFEIFCYFINYLKYPRDLNYKASIIGWTTTNTTDNWLNKKFDTTKTMLFIDPNDNEYDNVMLTNEVGRTYKIGFAISKGLQKHDRTVISYRKSDFSNSNLEKLQTEEIK